jgi:glycerate-2-kinase
VFDRSPAAPFPAPPGDAKGKDPVHATAFRNAVEGADAYRGIRSALRRDGATVRLGNRFVPLARYREVAFLALGNAAVSAAYAVHDALGPAATQGLVVGPNPLPVDVPFQHKIVGPGRPGHDGATAALADVLELASGLTERDLLVLLVTPGAVVTLAGPPAGWDPGGWGEWLERLRGAGATSAETADIVRALGSGGVGGGIARAAGKAEVVPLVVDRGEGGLRVGGGPASPLTDADRTAARAALQRLRAWETLPAPAREGLAPDASRPLGMGSNVHRPVAVAGPADALRGAGDAVAEREYTARLSAIAHPGGPEVVAESFLAAAEELVSRQIEARGKKSKGIVVFGGANFEVPEGGDEREAFRAFAGAASQRIRRRGMTVGVYQTSALPEPKGAPGLVVDASAGDRPAVPRALGMRPGITDVGCLVVAVVPSEPPA